MKRLKILSFNITTLSILLLHATSNSLPNFERFWIQLGAFAPKAKIKKTGNIILK